MMKYIIEVKYPNNEVKTAEYEADSAFDLQEKYEKYLKMKNLFGKVKYRIKSKTPGSPIQKLDEVEFLAAEREKIDLKKKKREEENLALALAVKKFLPGFTIPEKTQEIKRGLPKKQFVPNGKGEIVPTLVKPKKIDFFKKSKKKLPKLFTGRNFASFNNDTPKYDKKDHEQKFMEIMKQIRKGHKEFKEKS